MPRVKRGVQALQQTQEDSKESSKVITVRVAEFIELPSKPLQSGPYAYCD